MEAIILAGGFGTRLQSVVSDVPKPMAPINGKPFLAYLINYLIKKGITRVVLAVGYKKDIIMDYFKDCYKDVEIVYSIEDKPLFTGGAIKKALEVCTGENVFVVNGDTFFDIDFKVLYKAHLTKKADITIAMKTMYDFDRYGTVVTTDDNEVKGFYEKCYVAKGNINGGIYCINKRLLLEMDADKFSFEKDYLEKQVGLSKIYGIDFAGYFIDIGVPDDYCKAKEYLHNEE